MALLDESRREHWHSFQKNPLDGCRPRRNYLGERLLRLSMLDKHERRTWERKPGTLPRSRSKLLQSILVSSWFVSSSEVRGLVQSTAGLLRYLESHKERALKWFRTIRVKNSFQCSSASGYAGVSSRTAFHD